MLNGTKEKIENVFNLLEQEKKQKEFPPQKIKRRIKIYRCIQKAAVAITLLAFFTAFSILIVAICDVNSVWFHFDSTFKGACILIFPLTLLLLRLKWCERREVLRFYSCCEVVEPIKSRDNILGIINSKNFNDLSELDLKWLEIAMIHLRHQIECRPKKLKLIQKFIFSSIGISCLLFLFGYFLRWSIDKKIVQLMDFVLNQNNFDNPFDILNKTIEIWQGKYMGYEAQALALLAFAGIIFYFYNALDAKEIEEKWHDNHMIEILEYAICIASEKKQEAESIPIQVSTQPPMQPPSQDMPMSFLTQLRNFMCKCPKTSPPTPL